MQKRVSNFYLFFISQLGAYKFILPFISKIHKTKNYNWKIVSSQKLIPIIKKNFDDSFVININQVNNILSFETFKFMIISSATNPTSHIDQYAFKLAKKKISKFFSLLITGMI